MEKAGPGEMTDHPHHKSAWFCHGDVIPEGVELKHKLKDVQGIDFWSEAPGHGVIVCTNVAAPEQKGPHGRVVTTNEWRTADGEKVLDETRTLHLVNFGAAWLFVLETDLHASVAPLTFGDTKEGSFGIRVRKSVTEQMGKGTLTNAEGKVHERRGVGLGLGSGAITPARGRRCDGGHRPVCRSDQPGDIVLA